MNGELSANNHAVRLPFIVYYIEKLCVSLSNYESLDNFYSLLFTKL